MAEPVKSDLSGQGRFGSNYPPKLCQGERAGPCGWRENKVARLALPLSADDRLRRAWQADQPRLSVRRPVLCDFGGNVRRPRRRSTCSQRNPVISPRRAPVSAISLIASATGARIRPSLSNLSIATNSRLYSAASSKMRGPGSPSAPGRRARTGSFLRCALEWPSQTLR